MKRNSVDIHQVKLKHRIFDGNMLMPSLSNLIDEITNIRISKSKIRI